MSNPGLIIKILNLLNGLVMVLFMLKILHVVSFLGNIKILYLAMAMLVIYGMKSWVEITSKVTDPIRTSKITSLLMNAALLLLGIGVMFKVLQWPFSAIILLTGSAVGLLTYVLSFVVSADVDSSENPDVLDDFK